MRPEDRKIMELRKAKKVSQVSLAAVLHTHQLHIVKLNTAFKLIHYIRGGGLSAS